VTVKSLETARQCAGKTDKKGEYFCAGLPQGRYEISVKHKGFGAKVEVTIKAGLFGDPGSSGFANRYDIKLGGGGGDAARKDQEAFEKSKVGFERAVALNNAGKFEEALAELQPVAEKDPTQWVVHWQLALAYSGLNRNEEAEAAFKKAIELNPTNARLYNELGRFYMKAKRMEEARTQFETAANLSPEDAPIFWYNLAVTFYNAGDLRASIDPLTKVVELDPGHANAQFFLGVALYNTAESKIEGGQVKTILAPGTREHFETYLALAPDGQYANDAKQYLQIIDATVPAAVRTKKK
jgi:tetratricopeptide (TPR) repeat protein